MKKKILLVDDSRLVRAMTGDMLAEIDGLEILQAENGKTALAIAERENPALIILDFEMPVMDGIETLRELKARGASAPVIMLSSYTEAGAEITLQALELGAVDFITKPSEGSAISQVKNRLLEKTRAFLGLDQEHEGRIQTRRQQKSQQYDVVVIGASTGGPQVLQKIFSQLPGSFALPVLVVQHMPPLFTRAFADRLNSLSALRVQEAESGMALKGGQAYLAPGGFHLGLEGNARSCQIAISSSDPINSHKPSIDYTMKDALKVFGGRTIAILMTGMGRDGVEGMSMIYGAGGLTLAQDEASSVIFGMNRRAIEAGIIDSVLAAEEIPGELSRRCA